MSFKTAFVSLTAIFLTPLASLSFAFMPVPCLKAGMSPSQGFDCPAPYVELSRDGEDPYFERAWYCEATDHSLGALKDGGCAGSKGLALLPEWTNPHVSTVADTSNSDLSYSQEFDDNVMMACYEARYDRTPESERFGVDKETFVTMMKLLSDDDAIHAARTETIKLVRGKPKEKRMLIYEFAKKVCLHAK